MCDGSGTATGAILSLDAIGLQDTYTLSDDPVESFFNFTTHRHSNFSLYNRITKIDRPASEGSGTRWPFGQTVIINMKPQSMGDLLSNMFLKVTMPVLPDYNNVANPARYADQIGRHIFKKIQMRVDESVLDTTYDDYQIIYDELYRSDSDKEALKYLINNGSDYNELPTSTSGKQNIPFLPFERDGLDEFELLIPIQMFFSRKYSKKEKYSTDKFYYSPYFPLCAIHKQEINFVIDFHKQSFFTNSIFDISLSKFEIITEEITLSEPERNYFLNKKIYQMYEVSRINPSGSAKGKGSISKVNLVPNIPVKTIHWFLRNEEFENDDNPVFFKDRFNFSTTTVSNVYTESLNPIMNNTTLFLNAYEELDFLKEQTHHFQKYLESYNKNLITPNRNIYTYSMAMQPTDSAPTGSLDFEGINSDRTFLDTTLSNFVNDNKNYSLNIYYIGYQTLVYENGFVQLVFL